MRCLVTGGAGFIGSNIVKHLVERGDIVTVVDDLSSGRRDNIVARNVKMRIRDFASQSTLVEIRSQNFDIVFHEAAIPRVSFSVEQPALTTDVNVLKMVKLLEACRGNIKRFVFASSSSVYGGADILPTPVSYPKHPKSPYALQKSVGEDFVRMFSELYGLDAVSLRYFNVFGPNQYGDSPYSTAISAWCHALKNGLPLRSDGTGVQTRDMCYVDNVVEANILAAEHPGKFVGECFNVACGDRTSNNGILDYLRSIFGDLDIIHAPTRVGDVMHTQADISLTYSVLGYRPKVRVWSGLEKTLAFWGLLN